VYVRIGGTAARRSDACGRIHREDRRRLVATRGITSCTLFSDLLKIENSASYSDARSSATVETQSE
jgi:hypothetical protein